MHVFAAIDEVKSQFGPIAILVNNAGMGSTFSRFAKITPEFWEQVFRVNVTGTFNCCQAALPTWSRRGGVGSSTSRRRAPTAASRSWRPYVSSKSAVNGLTKSLALEVGARGITVNAIPPGFIDTPMLRASVERGEFGEGGIEGAIARTPVRRAGLPEDIAATCAFLCREEAGYITGQIIGVNGGRNT